MTRTIIVPTDGKWFIVTYDGPTVLAKIELRPENGWVLLRSLVEMLAPRPEITAETS